MNRCKTCAHWKPADEYDMSWPIGSGECTKAMPIWDATERNQNDDYRAYLRPEHAALLSFVGDGSEYMAHLITMPDFGCVQHEERLA